MADATRTDDLFARALGPRREIAGTEDFDCPWCGGDCLDVFDDNPVTACPHCHREFVCPDENGDLVCVGLLSPADMKYRAMRAAQEGERTDG